MRFAVISDIHSNFPALEAVSRALPEVDCVICCGDLVGYYCYPNEVCESVRSMKAVVIRGNHDAFVTGKADAGVNADVYRVGWTRSILTAENLNWLNSLPPEAVLNAGGITLHVRHASPWDESTYLYPDSPRLSEVVMGRDEWFLCGHTHRPLSYRTKSGGRIVNPGSVGQPRDYDCRASWALLDSDSRSFEIIRTEYPVVDFQNHLRALAWPPPVVDILSRTPQ